MFRLSLLDGWILSLRGLQVCLTTITSLIFNYQSPKNERWLQLVLNLRNPRLHRLWLQFKVLFQLTQQKRITGLAVCSKSGEPTGTDRVIPRPARAICWKILSCPLWTTGCPVLSSKLAEEIVILTQPQQLWTCWIHGRGKNSSQSRLGQFYDCLEQSLITYWPHFVVK